MKKFTKGAILGIALGLLQIIVGCLIGGFWGGCLFGGGMLYLFTYTIGKYLYDKAEKKRDQVMKNIMNAMNLQNDIRDAKSN